MIMDHNVISTVSVIFFTILTVTYGQVPPKSNANDGDYNTLHRDGSYEFGYSNDDDGSAYHISQANRNNVVRGRFGSRDPESGGIKETIYTAGPRGFRARGPNIHRKMDLDQRPRGPIGNKDDPYFDPNEDPSYSFAFKTPGYNREEAANRRGDVSGRYSYVDDVGERHNVEYIAGKDTGFHVRSAYPDSNPTSIGPLFYSGPLVRGEKKQRGHTSIQRGLDGSYRFVSAGPDQRRTESSDANGNVRGSYTFLDDKGVQRTVHYIAGPGIGYRIVKNNKDAPFTPPYFPTAPDYRDPNIGKPFPPPPDDGFDDNSFPDKDDSFDDVFGRPGGIAASGHVKPPAKKPSTPSKGDDSDVFDNDNFDFDNDNKRPGRPGSDTTRPGFDSGRPGSESGRPGTDSGRPGFDSGRPGFDSGRPGFDSGRPGFDSGRPGFDSGRPGFDSGRPGFDSGRPGADSRPGSKPGGNIDFSSQGERPDNFAGGDSDEDIFGKPDVNNSDKRPTGPGSSGVKPESETNIGLSPGFDVDEDDIFGFQPEKPGGKPSTSGGRPSTGEKPGTGGRPTGGRPETTGRPSSGGRPTGTGPSGDGGRPGTGGKPSYGTKPSGSGDKPFSGGRPGSDGRPGGKPGTGISSGRPQNGYRPTGGGRPSTDDRPEYGQKPSTGGDTDISKPGFENRPGTGYGTGESTGLDFDKPSAPSRPSDSGRPGSRPGVKPDTGLTSDKDGRPGSEKPGSTGGGFLDEDDDDIFGSRPPPSQQGESGRPGYRPGGTRPSTSPGTTISGTAGRPSGPTSSQGGIGTTGDGFLDSSGEDEGYGPPKGGKDKDKPSTGRPSITLTGDRDRNRGGTIFRNLGEETINFPPGASVRAHVQSIDLLPFGSKTRSPAEAVEDELKKHGSR